MKTLLLYLVFIVLHFTQSVTAQVENSNFNGRAATSLNTVVNTSNSLSNTIIASSIEGQQFYNNTVQMQQIGNYNSFNAQLKSNAVAITVLQKGNNNKVSFDRYANSINLKVLQQGDNNTIRDYAPYTNYDVKSEFIQKGSGQTISSFGSNSISRDLKVIQSGNGATVLLINTSKL